MRYSIFIDQKMSLKWGLNGNQSALFSLLTNLSSWAEEIFMNGKVYYFASRQMIINEIPLYYSKPDTVYKALCKLRDLELIEYFKLGVKDIVRITEKGNEWNSANLSEHSEINPNEFRNKSENDSEINPTYHNTNTNPNTKDQLLKLFREITGKNVRVVDNKAWKQFKARIKEGFTLKDFEIAIRNCKNDKFHIENPHYLTIEFITRSDKFTRYLNYSNKPKKVERQTLQNLDDGYSWTKTQE